MDVLREEYARELPNKLDELEALIEDARQQREAAAAAASAAHRLRGTAGAYGFNLVGNVAGHIEDLLCEYESSPSQIRRNFWDDIERAVVDARLASKAPELPRGRAAVAGDSNSLRTILFVDDDADARRTATALLKKQLVDVVVASSAAEALHKAVSTKLGAAIIDVYLGEESGFDLCAQLRALPGCEHLPVVMVSADESVRTRVAATHVGASLFLEKPLREDALSLVVQQLMDEAVAQRPRVLLLEDDRAFSDHAELLLQSQDIETRAIANPAALPETLELFQPDLVLLDIELPNTSGVDVCRALRMSIKWQTLPILMMTSHVDDHTRIESFRAGANDFISKPVLEEEFFARVNVQLTHTRLLRERAERDPLSGLMLRGPFLEAFEQRLSEARRHRRSLAVALIDLDHFKEVNDRFGHSSGDSVIAGFGQLLRHRFRNEDLRCRWGGEEFIVALPGQDSGLLERALGRVLEELSVMPFVSSDGERFTVSASAGVASHPDDGLSTQALIQRADARLYEAKRGGRKRIIGARHDLEEAETSRFRKLHSA
jgi:diguanylate cyclase (GGDEF)-like protein